MLKIWIIDDEPAVCQQLQMTLSLRGHEVETFPSWEDAVNAVNAITASPPDIVICDVNMPKMNGYQTLDAIRAHPLTRRVPVVLMTGRATYESMRQGMVGGANDYLPKPFNTAELVETITRQVTLRREAEPANAPARKKLPLEFEEALNGILGIAQLLESARTLSRERLGESGRLLRECGEKLQRLLEKQQG